VNRDRKETQSSTLQTFKDELKQDLDSLTAQPVMRIKKAEPESVELPDIDPDAKPSEPKNAVSANLAYKRKYDQDYDYLDADEGAIFMADLQKEDLQEIRRLDDEFQKKEEKDGKGGKKKSFKRKDDGNDSDTDLKKRKGSKMAKMPKQR
jgi:hypothetical protein